MMADVAPLLPRQATVWRAAVAVTAS